MRHPPKHRYADPAPLAIFCFGTTVLLLSLINVHARGVTHANVVIGLGFFMGGLGQMIGGIFEFILGNTFSMVTFIAFGGIWATLGIVLSPWSGIEEAYKDPKEFNQALGLMFMSWFAFVVCLTIASIRTFVGYFIALFLAGLTLLLLGCGHMVNNPGLLKAGGWAGLVCAGASYYCAAAALFREVGLVKLPNRSLIYNRTPPES